MWAHATEQGDAGSPGSGGASPYLRRACRVAAPATCPPANHSFNPSRMVRRPATGNVDQEFSCGLMPQSGVTQEAPAQAELRPLTSAGASRAP